MKLDKTKQINFQSIRQKLSETFQPQVPSSSKKYCQDVLQVFLRNCRYLSNGFWKIRDQRNRLNWCRWHSGRRNVGNSFGCWCINVRGPALCHQHQKFTTKILVRREVQFSVIDKHTHLKNSVFILPVSQDQYQNTYSINCTPFLRSSGIVAGSWHNKIICR